MCVLYVLLTVVNKRVNNRVSPTLIRVLPDSVLGVTYEFFIGALIFGIARM